MHAGRVFLPHIAALPEIDAVQLFRIGFKPERLIGTKLCYAFRHPQPQPMRAPGGGMVGACRICWSKPAMRSEEHTSELQSLMRISYDVFCLKKINTKQNTRENRIVMTLYKIL